MAIKYVTSTDDYAVKYDSLEDVKAAEWKVAEDDDGNKIHQDLIDYVYFYAADGSTRIYPVDSSFASKVRYVYVKKDEENKGIIAFQNLVKDLGQLSRFSAILGSAGAWHLANTLNNKWKTFTEEEDEFLVWNRKAMENCGITAKTTEANSDAE